MLAVYSAWRSQLTLATHINWPHEGLECNLCPFCVAVMAAKQCVCLSVCLSVCMYVFTCMCACLCVCFHVCFTQCFPPASCSSAVRSVYWRISAVRFERCVWCGFALSPVLQLSVSMILYCSWVCLWYCTAVECLYDIVLQLSVSMILYCSWVCLWYCTAVECVYDIVLQLSVSMILYCSWVCLWYCTAGQIVYLESDWLFFLSFSFAARIHA